MKAKTIRSTSATRARSPRRCLAFSYSFFPPFLSSRRHAPLLAAFSLFSFTCPAKTFRKVRRLTPLPRPTSRPVPSSPVTQPPVRQTPCILLLTLGSDRICLSGFDALHCSVAKKGLYILLCCCCFPPPYTHSAGPFPRLYGPFPIRMYVHDHHRLSSQLKSKNPKKKARICLALAANHVC